MNATARYVATHVLPTAYALLPPQMQSPQATRLLMTIGWQESRFVFRRQVRGPARGFWQFEREGGVRGVLEHLSTRRTAARLCETLGYPAEPLAIWTALEHHDVLAACWARLLLWTSPRVLPTTSDDGWALYLATWRPGKPHAETWPEFYRQAGDLQG